MPDAFDPYNEWLGIPPEDQPPHHYQLLGIDLYEGDAEKIAQAALSRTETLRTYQLGSHFEASQQLLNQVAQAKLCLLDTERKVAYDSELKLRLSPAEPPGPTATDPAKIPRPQPTAEASAEPIRNLDAQQPEEHVRDVAGVNFKEGALNDKDLGIGDRQIFQWLMQDEKSQPVVTEDSPMAVNQKSQPVVADDPPKIKYYKHGPREKETHFKYGKRDGLETHWYRNGQKWMESHYKDGKRDGRETHWYENGQRSLEGQYNNGKKDGPWTEWHQSGQQRMEGHYKNGKKDGSWTLWHQNGQKRAKGHYKNGKQDGPWTVWDENGNKVRKIQYKHGEEVSRTAHGEEVSLSVAKTGLSTIISGLTFVGLPLIVTVAFFVMPYDKVYVRWHENGQKASESQYKNGKLNRQTTWYENGQKEYESHWNNSELEGLTTGWYENGQKKGEGYCKNGKREGLWTWWDEDGNKTSETEFKDGKEVSRKEF